MSVKSAPILIEEPRSTQDATTGTMATTTVLPGWNVFEEWIEVSSTTTTTTSRAAVTMLVRKDLNRLLTNL